MRRLLLSCICLMVLGLPLQAQTTDHDVLLAPDGTLYTVFSEYVDPIGRVLRLRVQKGDSSETLVVPSTASGGYYSEPTLAYEPGQGTVFLFWQQLHALTWSELFFCSYREGVWSEATAIDNAVFRRRANLRLAVTALIDEEQTDGSLNRIPWTIIHAVWWEQGGGESIRYAMLSVEQDQIVPFVIRDMSSFLPEAGEAAEPVPEEELNREFARQPVIFQQPDNASVEVLFTDPRSSEVHRVEIRPRVAEGYLKPPIGRSGGGIGRPRMMAANNIGTVSVLRARGSDGLIFYFGADDRLEYVTYRAGAWSELQTIPLSGQLSRERGVNALRRMLATE